MATSVKLYVTPTWAADPAQAIVRAGADEVTAIEQDVVALEDLASTTFAVYV